MICGRQVPAALNLDLIREFLERLWLPSGEVAEWSIAVVLKTTGPKGPGGSNPSLSANFRRKMVPSAIRAEDANRLKTRDENEVRRSEAKMGRAKHQPSLPIPPSPPFSRSRTTGYFPLQPHWTWTDPTA